MPPRRKPIFSTRRKIQAPAHLTLTTKTKSNRQGKPRLKVVITADDAMERLEERKIILQRVKVIDDELRTFVREYGQPIQGHGLEVDNKCSVRDKVPRPYFVALAWMKLVLSDGMELADEAKQQVKAGSDFRTFMAKLVEIICEKIADGPLGTAIEKIAIRSRDNFLWETGVKAELLASMAHLDKSGGQGLYTYRGKAELKVRTLSDEDGKSESVPLNQKIEKIK